MGIVLAVSIAQYNAATRRWIWRNCPLQKVAIFFHWTKRSNSGNQSYGHAPVIIGIDNGELIYHDPENAPSTSALQALNAQLCQL
jgi:hypothetical protein